MRIVIAPQSFKGSLAAPMVAEAIATGVKRVFPAAELDLIPLADGGEGTVDALVASTGGEIRHAVATGPMGEKVDARWGLLGDGRTAVVEMAAASGLPLVSPDRRNPLKATTYGTGELIRAALDAGCGRLIVGIGGSATNDGGAGMAQALGAHLLDAKGKEIGPGGAELSRLARIDIGGLDPRLRGLEAIVASDVDNPLCGPRGASAVYGPQKGATPKMVARLDKALERYAKVISRDIGVDIRDMPGSGAAGGLGGGLVAFLNASLKPGIEIVLEATNFRHRLVGVDLVLSGEGRIDGQTVFGKTISGVTKLAKDEGAPVIAIVGGLGGGFEAVFAHGVRDIVVTVPGPVALAEAMEHAFDFLIDATERAMMLVKLGAEFGKRLTDLP